MPEFIPDDLTRVAGASQATTTKGSSIPYWGDSPAAWDTFVVDGKALPGIAKVNGSLKRSHDRKKSHGRHGATVTYLGDEPVEFDVTLVLWTSEHLKEYAEFYKARISRIKDAKSTLSGAVVTAYHPTLALYEVSKVHFVEFSFPEPRDGDIFEVKLKCLQFVDVEISKKAGVATARQAKASVPSLGSLKHNEISSDPHAKAPSKTETGP